MLRLMGTMYARPATETGISSVSAVSGPYAAELSALSPKTGTPSVTAICSARSSEDASGRPIKKSMRDK